MQLHQTSRRWICRTLFVFGCALPTLAVLVWAAAAQLPGRQRQWNERLGRLLDQRVEVGHVAHPRPGLVWLTDIHIRDVEFGHTLARLQKIELSHSGEQTVLRCFGGEAARADFGWLWRAGHRQLRWNAGQAIVLTLDEFTGSTSQGDAVRVSNLHARLQPIDQGAQVDLSWQAQQPGPLRMRWVRRREQGKPQHTLQLDARQADLPLRLAASVLPGLKRLGDNCRFRGTLWAQETGDGWRGQAAGKLQQVDLGALGDAVPDWQLAAVGSLDLRAAEFAAGRLRRLEASLQTGRGTIARQTLQRWLAAGICLPTTQLPREASSQFEQLALSLRLDGRGLRVRGLCDQQGSLLVGPDGPWLHQPTAELLPVEQIAELGRHRGAPALLAVLPERTATVTTASAAEPELRR